MLQLAAWLLVCAAVAWWTRRRPLVAVSLALLLWSLVPAVAAQHLTGQPSGATDVHPASLLLVVVTAVAVLTSPRAMFTRLAHHPFATLALTLFLAIVAATYALTGGQGINVLVDQVLAPLMLFWVVLASAPRDPAGLLLLRNTVIGAVSLQCLLAIVESIQDDFLLYGEDYAGISWFDPERFTRWPGTTDHPLVLALAIGVAAPLTVGLRSSALRVTLLVLQVVGVLITQSRVGLFVMVLVVVYLFLRGRMSPVGRIVTAVGAAAGIYALASSALASGVLDRIDDDGGSAAGRADAYGYVLSNLESFWFTGHGLGSHYDVARTAGLGTSFESSFLMYAVDFGVLAALAYFGALLGVTLAHASRTVLLGAPVAALAGLSMAQVFSAFAYSNLTGAFVWAAAALVVAGAARPSGPPLSSTAPRRREPLAAARRR